MGTHIIDAFIVTFGIDPEGCAKGEREIEVATKRLREDNKRTFDDMEKRGKSAAQTFKGVRNEVVGLGLAFLGANTVAGLISGMMTGAAVADRLGKTMDMSAKQVWSWRMAMKGVGGQVGDADAALQTIQKAKMGWIMGGDTGNNLAFSRLGVSAKDLQSNDPGAILKKIAGMQGKLDPKVYANLLQQIGMPSSMVYFLQQGKDSVDKLLAEYERNSTEQEKLAKETEELQKTVSTLQATIMGKLVPPLVTIANALNRWLGNGSSSGATPGGRRQIGPAWLGLYAGDSSAAPTGAAGTGTGMGGLATAQRVLGGLGFNFGGGGGGSISATAGKGRTRADRNNNPGNIEDGRFARSQPGYVGSDGRFAKFATPADGFAAMETLLTKNYLSKGQNTIASIIAKYAPASENNVGAYASQVERATGINRHQQLRQDQIHAVAAAMAKHEGYSGTHTHNTTNNFHIRSTDPKAAAREVAATQRRSAVSQADRGVAP